MAMSGKLKEYLDGEGIDYEVLSHPEAFTAQETAGAQHVPGAKMIKATIVKADGQFIMCVLSSVHMVDMEKFKDLAGVSDLVLATEAEMGQLFPDYELGAEPPFGNLYGLSTYVDKFLEQDDVVVFNAGSHTETVKMAFDDFVRLAKPAQVGDFGRHI